MEGDHQTTRVRFRGVEPMILRWAFFNLEYRSPTWRRLIDNISRRPTNVGCKPATANERITTVLNMHDVFVYYIISTRLLKSTIEGL